MRIDLLKQTLARVDLLLGSGRRRAWIAGGAGALALLIAIGNASWKLGSGVSIVVSLALLAVAAAVALRCAGVRWASVGLIVAGVGVYGFYLTSTPWDVRNFDALGHLKYIQFLVRHRAFPVEGDCSICHHPPAYHLLAAVVYAGCERAGMATPVQGVQVLSLVLWLGFLGLSSLTIQRLVSRPYQQTLATAFVVFWPYSIINSVRVNNDTLVYVLSAAAIYLLVRWYQQPRARWLVLGSLCAAVALLTKMSALSLVALVCAVVALRLATRPGRAALFRRSAPIVGVLVLAVAVYATVRASRGKDFVRGTLGTAYRTQGIDFAPRTARYYLTFDFRSLVRRPYVEVGIGLSEPTYWNHVVKSSLYGTGQRLGPVGTMLPSPKIALALICLLPALTGVLLLGLSLGRRDPRRRRLLCVAMAATFVAVGLAFHMTVPAAHHADFRFIMPVLIPISVLYAHAVEALRRRLAWAAVAAGLLAGVFLGLSAISFLWMSPQTEGSGIVGGMELRAPLFFLTPKKPVDLSPAASGR